MAPPPSMPAPAYTSANAGSPNLAALNQQQMKANAHTNLLKSGSAIKGGATSTSLPITIVPQRVSGGLVTNTNTTQVKMAQTMNQQQTQQMTDKGGDLVKKGGFKRSHSKKQKKKFKRSKRNRSSKKYPKRTRRSTR